MTNHLRTVLIGVFLACATLVAAVGITRHHSGTDPTPRGPYVALGDSYTAGPRIPDRTGAPPGAIAPTTTTRRWSPSGWGCGRPTSAT